MAETTDTAIAFQEVADYEKGFAAFFETSVRPYMESLEADRLVTLAEVTKRKKHGLYIGGGVLAYCALRIIFAPNLFWLFMEAPMLPIGVFAVIAGVIGAWIAAPALSYQSAKKNLLVPKMMQFFGDFAFVPKDGIPKDNIAQTHLIPINEINRFSVTDTVIGTRNGQRLSIAHVFAAIQGKHEYVLFNGECILAEMPKRRFAHVTVVRTLEEVRKQAGFVPLALQPVELEDPEFSAHFEVCGDDQVEARYLLTPDVMAKLDELAKLDETRTLQCSFVDDTLCISINGMPTLFRSSDISQPAFNVDDIHAFLKRIHLALSLVDLLDG